MRRTVHVFSALLPEQLFPDDEEMRLGARRSSGAD
jgi:hypothetical protein